MVFIIAARLSTILVLVVLHSRHAVVEYRQTDARSDVKRAERANPSFYARCFYPPPITDVSDAN